MSGLDGLGWPNPEDEPKPKKTMNSQLEIKLAPTPESDAMEYCDAMCDPDRVVEADFARKLERERDEAQERADTMFAKHVDILDQTRNERDQWRNEHDRVVREFQHRLTVIGISVIDATSYPESALGDGPPDTNTKPMDQ